MGLNGLMGFMGYDLFIFIYLFIYFIMCSGCRRQMTVHNAMAWFRTAAGHDVKRAISVVSDNLDHSTTTVFRHLILVINHLIATLPTPIERLVVWSDCAPTQYRNTNAFANIATVVWREFGLPVVWNFTAPGHGKGSADGIGAHVKRKGTDLVYMGAPKFRDSFDFCQRVHLDGITIINADATTNYPPTVLPADLKKYSCVGLKRMHAVRAGSTAGKLLAWDFSCRCDQCLMLGTGSCPETEEAAVVLWPTKGDLVSVSQCHCLDHCSFLLAIFLSTCRTWSYLLFLLGIFHVHNFFTMLGIFIPVCRLE
jgi:hypothetical protein